MPLAVRHSVRLARAIGFTDYSIRGTLIFRDSELSQFLSKWHIVLVGVFSGTERGTEKGSGSIFPDPSGKSSLHKFPMQCWPGLLTVRYFAFSLLQFFGKHDLFSQRTTSSSLKWGSPAALFVCSVHIYEESQKISCNPCFPLSMLQRPSGISMKTLPLFRIIATGSQKSDGAFFFEIRCEPVKMLQ